MENGVIQLSQRYQKDPQIVSRTIAGESILVPIRPNADDLESIYTLNETGALVWSLLDGKHTLAEIRDALVSDFEIEAEEAQQDLIELIQDLVSIRAVVKI